MPVRSSLLAFSTGLFLFAHAAAAATAATLPPPAAAAMHSISVERIAAQVRFLSSDLLEGRGTGARGGDIAADYIATQFALLGLQPAGDNGTYLQKVRFTGITLKPEQSTATLAPAHGEPIKLHYGDDYMVNDEYGVAGDDIDAPIVFVGFGINAPEYGWDDFAGTDVRGKMLLLFVNEPPSDDPKFFNGPALTYYGRWMYKYEEAARRGAIGVLIIHRTDLASYSWDVVRNSWGGEEVQLADDSAPRIKAAAWIHLDMARRLLALDGKDLDAMYTAAGKRGFKPFELTVRFKAHLESVKRGFESSNVVAMLPGRAQQGAKVAAPTQAVLYSAHYDHLGIVPGSGDDLIYNGAVDNGTGCGILLELARAFATATQRPPHPIIFAAVTAEEKGLLGSRYLGEHPPLPARDLALNLNYDAIDPVGVPQSITITGAERTTFYPTVEQMAQRFHLAIEPDSNPGAGHYYRSDHFSMARVGVPGFSIGQGVLFEGHPRSWGLARQDDYSSHRYHEPNDEFRADMDFRGNALLARFGFALGWLASSQSQTIGWQHGDEFEAARQASMTH